MSKRQNQMIRLAESRGYVAKHSARDSYRVGVAPKSQAHKISAWVFFNDIGALADYLNL